MPMRYWGTMTEFQDESYFEAVRRQWRRPHPPPHWRRAGKVRNRRSRETSLRAGDGRSRPEAETARFLRGGIPAPDVEFRSACDCADKRSSGVSRPPDSYREISEEDTG